MKKTGKVRELLFNEQGGKCYYCNRVMTLSYKITRDRPPHDLDCTLEHIFNRHDPRRYDPEANIDGKRLVTACHQCNQEKGSRDCDKLEMLPNIPRYAPWDDPDIQHAYSEIEPYVDPTPPAERKIYPSDAALLAELTGNLNNITFIESAMKTRLIATASKVIAGKGKTRKVRKLTGHMKTFTPQTPKNVIDDFNQRLVQETLDWKHQPDITTIEEPYQIQPLNFACGKCLDIFNSLPADVKWMNVSRTAAEPHCGC